MLLSAPAVSAAVLDKWCTISNGRTTRGKNDSLIHVIILRLGERFVLNKEAIYIWKSFPAPLWDTSCSSIPAVHQPQYSAHKEGGSGTLFSDTHLNPEKKPNNLWCTWTAAYIRMQQGSVFGSLSSSEVCSCVRWNALVTEATYQMLVWNWRLNSQTKSWWLITAGCSSSLS